jgi:hypothetical protein
MEKLPVTYRESEEIAKIARDLIYDYHTDLAVARIRYLFRSETATSKGKEIWGKARKVSGLNAWLAGEESTYEGTEPLPFFVIEISEPVWRKLDDKGKRALVDHELMHCDIDLDSGKYNIVPHDLEEFNSIVRRHGLWRADVEFFVKAANEKLPLFDRPLQEEQPAEAASKSA